MNLKFGIIFLCLGSLVSSKFEKCGSFRSDSTSNLFAFQGSTDEDDIKAPWLAAVGKLTQKVFKDFKVDCSGVIVTRGIIVTAAHCFVGFIKANRTELIPTHVRVGANRIDSKFSEDRKIKEYIVHPNYMFPAFYFDIALILLEEDLIFSSRISPICLPETSQSHPGANSAISVQGWGKDVGGSFGKKVSEANVAIRSKSECDFKFRHAGFHLNDTVYALMPHLSDDTTFCADATISSQMGTCVGDSGGPALQK